MLSSYGALSARIRNYVGRTGRLRNQSGLSLMEIMLVVAVIAFFLIGALALFLQAQSSSRAQRGQQQLMGLATNIRTLYSGQPSYDGLNAQTLINANAVPSDMVLGDDMRNVWGGAVTVSTTGNDAGFTIRFDEVPREACVRMLTTGGGAGGFRAVSIGAGGGNNIPVPISPDVASNNCNDTELTITWTF